MSPSPLPFSHPLKVASLAARKPTRFSIAPDTEARAQIAQWLEINAVRDLRFVGAISPKGQHDWTLEGKLTARIVQPCIISLAPVTTMVNELVARQYLAQMPEPEGDEIEMPDDTDSEPLPAVIDVGQVMLEALQLALPLYPRAPGAELGSIEAAAPGSAPLEPEARRPFAGLADLMKEQDKTKQ